MRILPLYDPAAQPSTWNERMMPGEFAVLSSLHRESAGASPVCTIFPSRAEAKAYAEEEVARCPTMRCLIYDHEGLGKSPADDMRGAEFKDKTEMSARVRQWLAGILLLGGMALFTLDWSQDFRLSWPAMLGTRMIPTGLLLLAFELGIRVHAAQRKRAQHPG